MRGLSDTEQRRVMVQFMSKGIIFTDVFRKAWGAIKMEAADQ